MNSLRLAFALGWVLVCSGCTYSVYPLFEKRDLAHDVDLNGAWKHMAPAEKDKPAGSLVLKLEGFDKNSSYDFQLAWNEKDPEDYVARVGRLGEQLYLELRPLEDKGPPFKDGICVYAFARLEVAQDQFTLREPDERKCRELLKKAGLPYFIHPQPEPGAMVENTILTMPTAELQRFVTAHHAELFTGRELVFRRVAEPKKPPAKP